MGHEGVLTSSVVMLTTLFSAFTLTGWLYILRSMEWFKNGNGDVVKPGFTTSHIRFRLF